MSGFIWIFGGLLVLLILKLPKIAQTFNPNSWRATKKYMEFGIIESWSEAVKEVKYVMYKTLPIIEHSYSVKLKPDMPNTRDLIDKYGEDAVFYVGIKHGNYHKGFNYYDTPENVDLYYGQTLVKENIQTWDLLLFNPKDKDFNISDSCLDYKDKSGKRICPLSYRENTTLELERLLNESSDKFGNGSGKIPNYKNASEIPLEHKTKEEEKREIEEKRALRKKHEDRIKAVLGEREDYCRQYFSINPYASYNEAMKWYYFKLYKTIAEALADGVCMDYALKYYIYSDMPVKAVKSLKGNNGLYRDHMFNILKDAVKYGPYSSISYYLDEKDKNLYRSLK